MSIFAHDTVATQYVEASGIRFAYRRFGMPDKTPLVFLQHFRGNMDNYDSAITDPLSMDREIVLFDNTGVGDTNGEAKRSVTDMARDALRLSLTAATTS
jgi:pimeloyl-ACP methyl ester carboxylesterase